jgi:hypothetical protein
MQELPMTQHVFNKTTFSVLFCFAADGSQRLQSQIFDSLFIDPGGRW